MQVTFEGTIHEILDQIEGFCKSVIKEHTQPITCSVTSPATIVTFTPEDQAVAKVAVAKLKEVVPDVSSQRQQAGEPEVEKAPEDLQAACMGVVNGDKEKKKRLVEILGSYDAKTINGLAPEYRDEFWSKVKDL